MDFATAFDTTLYNNIYDSADYPRIEMPEQWGAK